MRPGTYFENINFLGKAIELRSELGPEGTVIDGRQQGSVIVMSQGEGPEALVEGFTLTNGSGTLRPVWNNFWGGGVLCFNTSPTIAGNIIRGNSVQHGYTSGGGGGILCYLSASRIEQNDLMENEAFSGGGLFCHTSACTVEQNTICSNLAANGGGIGCCYDASLIAGNALLGNHGNGGGIECNNSPGTKIIGNVISQNTGGDAGGGVAVTFSDGLMIRGNIVTDNSTGMFGRGGGICIQMSVVTLVGNTIAGNTAAHGGGGLCCQRDSAAVVVNSLFCGNDGPTGKEIWLSDDPCWGPVTLSIGYSDVMGGQSSIQVDPLSTLHWGPGMIDAGPLFVDGAAGDFHLTWNSPCRDAGVAHPDLPPEDFEGDPRLAGAGVDIGADEFYFHLYEMGDVAPGAGLDINVIGPPGTAGVVLALGSGVRPRPLPTAYGDFFLELPVLFTAHLGSIPASGVLARPATVPAWWSPGDQKPFQALAGWRLTNPMVLEVE